jgi:hypothetical protein
MELSDEYSGESSSLIRERALKVRGLQRQDTEAVHLSPLVRITFH